MTTISDSAKKSLLDFRTASKFYGASRAYHVMAKPIGSACNLNCSYCYYLEKESIYPSGIRRMPDDTLELFVSQYIESQPGKEVSFVWQGGEPSLAGIPFFQKIIQLQNKHRGQKIIQNAFQTNGTLFNEDWCRFFADNQFLVGVSIDGPEHLHDYYRKKKNNSGSFREVMHAISLMHRYKVEFNTLSTVNSRNAEYPMEVYQFLKRIGSRFIQFLPVVERRAIAPESLSLVHQNFTKDAMLTDWSVKPGQYGKFLTVVFEEWKKQDIGSVFIQIIEAALANRLGLSPGLCVFDKTCGHAMVLEHNGDVFSCDHFVYPEYLLGNIKESRLPDMLQSSKQVKFGLDKHDTLPSECIKCPVLYACNGECPKHRFAKSASGEMNLSYLCQDYLSFFSHIDNFVDEMARQIINH